MHLFLLSLCLLVSITEPTDRIQSSPILQPFKEKYQQINLHRDYYDITLPTMLTSIRQFSPRKTQDKMLNLFESINIHPIDLNIFKELQTRYPSDIAYLILSSRGLIDYLAFDIIKPTGDTQGRPQWMTTSELFRQCYWHLYFTYLYEIILTESQIIPSFDQLFDSEGNLIHGNIRNLFDDGFIPWTRSNIQRFQSDLLTKLKILSTYRTLDRKEYTTYQYPKMINDVLSPWENFARAASALMTPGQEELLIRCHERYLTDLLQEVVFKYESLRFENKMKIVYIAVNGYFNGRPQLFELLKQQLSDLPGIMRQIRASRISRFFGVSYIGNITALADETEFELEAPMLLEAETGVRRLTGGNG